MVCRDEEDILPYTLRHYRTMTDDITIYDAGSVDRSKEIAASFGAKIIDWDTGGELNSEIDQQLKTKCWVGSKADWVIVIDTDEFIYLPDGLKTIEECDAKRIAVVKPHGWDMFSDVFPTTSGQIYEEVKFGAPADYWYGKPALFSPKRLKSLRIGHGGHDCQGVLLNGARFEIPPTHPHTQPPVHMLHFKHLGPVERIAENNRLKRSRLAAINVKMRWGNLDDPLVHAQQKRDGILDTLRRVAVIP
jgi:hypothetical protein